VAKPGDIAGNTAVWRPARSEIPIRSDEVPLQQGASPDAQAWLRTSGILYTKFDSLCQVLRQEIQPTWAEYGGDRGPMRAMGKLCCGALLHCEGHKQEKSSGWDLVSCVERPARQLIVRGRNEARQHL